MPSPFFLLDPNSPQMQAMIGRNPNSIMAQFAQRNQQGTAIGSNNAGGYSGPAPTPNMQGGGNSFAGLGSNNMPSFAAGGMMSEQGTAIRPGAPMPPAAGTGRTLPSARFKVEPQEPQLGAAASTPMSSKQIDQEAQRFMQSQPQEVQQIQQVIEIAMQTGELTLDELNQAVQLAKVALANPASYPQVREFAISNGIATEQDLPEEMDQGLLYALILAGKIMQAAGSRVEPTTAGNAMAGQSPAPTGQKGGILPEYSEGGMTGDKAHIAKLHPREYVIPEEALLYHGKKHFDKLVEQARNPDGTNQQ